MKTFWLVLSTLVLASTPGRAADVLSNLLNCHEGLIPYMNGEQAHHRYGRLAYDIDYWQEIQDGVNPFAKANYSQQEKNRMAADATKKHEQYGPANLIVNGTRAGKLGVYVLEQTAKGNVLRFYPLPKPEGESSVESRTSSDAAEGSTKADEYEFRVYHIAVPIGGVLKKFPFAGRFNGPGKDRPMYLTCTWDCDNGAHQFAELKGEEVPLNDKAAEKAFTDTITTELSHPEQGFHVNAGVGHLRPAEAVQNCLASFPADSPLGKVIQARSESLVDFNTDGSAHNKDLGGSKNGSTAPNNHK